MTKVSHSAAPSTFWYKVFLFLFQPLSLPNLSSLRVLRCRPDVRSADAALRHTRQLLSWQHDPAQGQPGRPHHALAPTLDTPTPPPSPHPLDWVDTYPSTRLMGQRRQRPVIFLFLNPASGITPYVEPPAVSICVSRWWGSLTHT